MNSHGIEAHDACAMISELQVDTENVMSLQGFTPLMRAAQNGNLKIIKLLLAAGANAQAANTHVSQLTAVIHSVQGCVLYSVMGT